MRPLPRLLRIGVGSFRSEVLGLPPLRLDSLDTERPRVAYAEAVEPPHRRGIGWDEEPLGRAAAAESRPTVLSCHESGVIDAPALPAGLHQAERVPIPLEREALLGICCGLSHFRRFSTLVHTNHHSHNDLRPFLPLACPQPGP